MSRTFRLVSLSALVVITACNNDPVSRTAGGSCTTAITVDAAAPPLTLDITGTCELAELGHTTMAARQTVSTTNGAVQNITTYTAADGDKLTTVFTGQVTSPPGPDVVFTGVETYTGGTGRFSGATGSSALTGTATLGGPTGTGQYTTHGTMMY